MNVEYALVLLACLVAVATDLRSRTIPNAVPGAVALVALGTAATHGFVAFAIAFAILMGVLVVGTFAFANGWLGGGDVKLLAAVSAVFAPQDALAFLTATSISGGVIALGFALAARKLPSTLAAAGKIARPFAIPGTVAVAPAAPTTMPYALAIAAGFALVVFSHFTPISRLSL